MPQETLEQAISHLRAGNRAEARKLLASVLRQDKGNLRAWQWMYDATENDQEKRHCLDQILRLDPGNQKAAQLRAQMDGLTVGTKQDKSVDDFRKTIKTISGQEINKNQKIGIGILSIFGLCIFACIGLFFYLNFSQVDTPDEYLKEYGGSIEVYTEILASTDCNKLQNSFDLAYSNNQLYEPGSSAAILTTGYMQAADQRIQEIDCYEQPLLP